MKVLEGSDRKEKTTEKTNFDKLTDTTKSTFMLDFFGINTF